MNISNISFSSAKKHKSNNVIRNLDEQVKVSVPKNYKIVIKPDKEKLVMTPQPQEDEFVSNETEDKSTETEKSINTDNKIKKEKAVKKQNKTKSTDEKDDQSAIEKAKKITRIVVTVIMTALSALGLKEGRDLLEYQPEVSSAVVDYNSKENDIADIAKTYNVDEDVIRYSNGIYSDNDLSEVNQLTIPTRYDYLDDVIDDKTQELYRSKPYSEQYYSIGKELDALNAKNEKQEEIADTYCDGETVYISLKDEEDDPKLAQQYEDSLVPVDYIEKLFDIKDGELHKYNTFVSKNKNQYIQLGTTLKVPKSSIDTDNINLSDYLK